MALSQALFSAISGLTNHQTKMDNIGNNLANVNTVGYKKTVFQFHTLLSEQIQGGTVSTADRGSINPITIGLGTQTGSITSDFSQGSAQTTGNARDLMIEGNGFFVVRNGNSTYLTRDGAFYIGTDGRLLGGNGLPVQGITANEGELPEASAIEDLVIPLGQSGAARETTAVSMTGNLNSNLEVALPNTIDATSLDASTWITAGGGGVDGTATAYINAGHVETSAALWDSAAGGGIGAPATGTTLLGDLQFLRGTQLVSPFANVDVAGEPTEITINYRKGGRSMEAIFTYGDNTITPPDGDGTTVADLMRFLTGGVGDVGDTAAPNDQRLLGGAMGTVHVQERTLADDGYDAPAEQGGSFMRSFLATDVNAVDYDNSGAKDPTNCFSIVSNLGIENAITDIEISYNNINYTDMFSPDPDYGELTGGSTTTNVVVYDSLGNPKNVTMQMTLVNRDSNFSTWRWVADSVDDTDATWLFNQFNAGGGAESTSINVGAGLIRFDSEGRFVAGSELSETGGLEITQEMRGVNFPISVKIQEGLSSALSQDLNFTDLTQVARASDFNLKSQNGSAPGTLDSFTVTDDGVINGVYSNGVLEVLGQISIASVTNVNGLVSVGQNMYRTDPSSGPAIIGAPKTGGRGSVRAGALELSNVDLSQEFTDMIITQRGFQANARVITTSDEMLVELTNMKR